jgi:ribosomal protein S28E/S33
MSRTGGDGGRSIEKASPDDILAVLDTERDERTVDRG